MPVCLAEIAEGEVVELVIDANEALDNDLHAWSRTTGHQLVSVSRTGPQCRYLIRKNRPRRTGCRFAAVISNPGLEELLSPLGFALAAALEGVDVSLYFQGPAVRVLSRGILDKLSGPTRPFSRFARNRLSAVGHVPAQAKITQLQNLGAHLYVCGPSMQHFKVSPKDLAFNDVIIAEYLTLWRSWRTPTSTSTSEASHLSRGAQPGCPDAHVGSCNSLGSWRALETGNQTLRMARSDIDELRPKRT